MAGRPLQNNLSAQRYGMLTVIERAPNKCNKVRWLCQCDCGNQCVVQTFDLMFGKTRSCGCYRRERQREIHTKSQRNHTYNGRESC